MSTIGQIVVDGRIYPSQSSSPAAASVPPGNSPSPGQARPPQQMSPIDALHQLPSPSGSFQTARINAPPPYNQFQNNGAQYQQSSMNNGPMMGQQGGQPMVAPTLQSLTQLNQNLGQSMSKYNWNRTISFLTSTVVIFQILFLARCRSNFYFRNRSDSCASSLHATLAGVIYSCSFLNSTQPRELLAADSSLTFDVSL